MKRPDPTAKDIFVIMRTYQSRALADAMVEAGYARSRAQAVVRALRAEASKAGVRADDFPTLRSEHDIRVGFAEGGAA